MDNDDLLVLIKDVFDKKTDEIKSFVEEKIKGQNILNESLKSDVKVVAEGYDNLNRKIDKNIEQIKTEIKEIKSEIKVIECYIIGVDAKLTDHDIILKRVK